MSVQSEISRLESAKADLKAVLEEKGVTVPETAKLDDYGALVRQIVPEGAWMSFILTDLPEDPSADYSVTPYAPILTYRYLTVELPEDKDCVELLLGSNSYACINFVKLSDGQIIGPNSEDRELSVYSHTGQKLVIGINTQGRENLNYYRCATAPF